MLDFLSLLFEDKKLVPVVPPAAAAVAVAAVAAVADQSLYSKSCSEKKDERMKGLGPSTKSIEPKVRFT